MLIQICDAEDIRILKSVVSKDRMHGVPCTIIRERYCEVFKGESVAQIVG